MVTYKLVEQTEKQLIYNYYPEVHMDKEPGVIVVDIDGKHAQVTKLAEEDREIKKH